MEVGVTIVMRVPLIQVDVKTRLGRITDQDRVRGATIAFHPFDLAGKLNGYRSRVEIGGLDRTQPPENRERCYDLQRSAGRAISKHGSSCSVNKVILCLCSILYPSSEENPV
jgi:hypothetical protein